MEVDIIAEPTPGSGQLKNKGVSYEEAVRQVGGFGRFQKLSSILLIFGFLTGSYMMYQLPLMTFYPDYLCLNKDGSSSESCKRSFICDNDLPKDEWKIDYDSKNSFHNWVDPDKLDLTCTSGELVGLMGTSYFVAFALGSLFIPYWADQKGRRYVYFISMMVQNVGFIVIVLSKSIYLTIGMYFIVGLQSGARVGIGPNYMAELLPKAKIIPMTTLLSVCDGSVTGVQAIMMYYTRSWIVVESVGLVFVFLTVLLIFVIIPESPKYLYANRQFDEARAKLKMIARFNGIPSKAELDFIFDTEYELEQMKKDPSHNDEHFENERSASRASSREKLIDRQIQAASPTSTTPSSKPEEAVKVEAEANLEKSGMFLKGTLKEVWGIWQIRRNFLAGMLIFSTCTFSYFLLNFEVKYMEGGMIRNTLVSSSAEIFADLIGGVLYFAIGPRKGFFFLFFLNLFGTAFLIKFWDNPAILPWFLMIAKIGATGANAMCYVANIYLIPTIFATTVFGFWNFATRMVSSLSSLLAEIEQPLPLIINVGVTLIGGMASLAIIEKLPKFK